MLTGHFMGSTSYDFAELPATCGHREYPTKIEHQWGQKCNMMHPEGMRRVKQKIQFEIMSKSKQDVKSEIMSWFERVMRLSEFNFL